jgi:NAD(P)-dependent dehydrogenase (short-subunit alcohol dehydrogenase family)
MNGVLVVTGGGRGIGAATCLKAGRAGYRVAVNYQSDSLSAEGVAAAIESAGGKAIAVKADMAQLADIARLFDEAQDRLGPIAAVVNNAGITGRSSRLDAASDETIRATIDLNVTGAILVAREAVRRMSTRHGGQGGVIVNISSAASTLGSPGEYTWYAASKGAIESFTIGLAREVAEEGIRVCAVAPGLTETEIHGKSTGDAARVARLAPSIPMKRPGQANEIADSILYLLSDQASYITGTTLRVSGGR